MRYKQQLLEVLAAASSGIRKRFFIQGVAAAPEGTQSRIRSQDFWPVETIEFARALALPCERERERERERQRERERER